MLSYGLLVEMLRPGKAAAAGNGQRAASVHAVALVHWSAFSLARSTTKISRKVRKSVRKTYLITTIIVPANGSDVAGEILRGSGYSTEGVVDFELGLSFARLASLHT